MPAWSSNCGASIITTSSGRAISATRWCRLRDGRATIRNGKAIRGGSPGSIAARSDHSRALPDGSASTSRTVLPAWAKMCASQTAEVVLPVPGLRLSRATLRAGINAVLQCLLHYGSRSGSCDARGPGGADPLLGVESGSFHKATDITPQFVRGPGFIYPQAVD